MPGGGAGFARVRRRSQSAHRKTIPAEGYPIVTRLNAAAAGACAVLVWLAGMPPVPAFAAAPSEAALLKAAFVFNFTKYTEWPEGVFAASDSPIWLCLLTADSDAAQAMRTVDGRNSKGRVLRVKVVADADELKSCQIVFVEQGAVGSLRRTLNSLGAAPVLTVGDGENFATRGGIIELQASGQRLGFAVNIDAAKRSGVRLSAQLLSLARIVRDS